nr:thioredoxin family protein [Clostridium perfringens]
MEVKNKRKLIILGLILFSLIGIYLGKNYIEGRKQINFQSINVIENLEEAKEGIPTIIMFKTDTCPYCVEMQKELSYVSKEREGKFNIYYARLEEEKNIDLAYKYGAKVVPTTVFLDKDGNKFYVHQGLMRKNNIETILNSLGVK